MSTIAMKGGGYYSLATQGARHAIDAAIPLALSAIEAMPIEGSGPLTVSDMGCADGGTSLELIRAMLSALRDRAPGRSLQLVYTDLPRNDYSQVFQLAHGLTDRPGLTTTIDNLFVLASATSFHQPILPPGTLDLGFSATAMHYLSRLPQSITDHVHSCGTSGAIHDAYASQARADWQAVLLARAAEMRPGSRLVILNFCRDEQNRYLGHTGGINMFEFMNELWAGFVDDGTITAAEYLATNFQQHYRTIKEFTDPLTDPSDPVHRAGLRLVSAQSRVVRCPFAADFEEHGDAARFAAGYVPSMRSWSETCFMAGLSPERPQTERVAIVDRFYAAYTAAVEKAPDGHAKDLPYLDLVIEKV
jgi:indole-3-acetate O-methyltransferase